MARFNRRAEEWHAPMVRAIGNLSAGAACIVGHFAPAWLVGLLAAGWAFNAIMELRSSLKAGMLI